MKAKEKPLENSLRITRYLTTSLHNSWLEILSQKYYGQRQNYLVGRQGKNEDIVNTYIHNEDTTRDKMFTSRQSSQFFAFLFFGVFFGGVFLAIAESSFWLHRTLFKCLWILPVDWAESENPWWETTQ